VIAPERGELEAMRSLLAGPGGEAQEVGGALCTCFPQAPASAMFNRALGLGLDRPATADDLTEIAAFFAARGVAYGVPLAPEAEPPELPGMLEERGFRRGYAWTKFERPPDPAPPLDTDLRIEEVDDGAVFADVFIRAYGVPAVAQPLLERLVGLDGWHCFVAYDGEAAAATAAVVVTGTVAWFGAAGTLPDFRRRGAQSALLRTRIEAARRDGCTVLVTETGEPIDGKPGNSYRNLVRAGFEPVYVRQNYLSSEDADTSGTRA
jgi:GNAT superfamily N-acetyltransferase